MAGRGRHARIPSGRSEGTTGAHLGTSICDLAGAEIARYSSVLWNMVLI